MITRRAKLDLQMGSLVVRSEDIIRIHIDEISVLIIESTAVSMTAALLAELSRKKVKVIFCDEKRLPSSELVSYYGSHDTSLKYRRQAIWSAEVKEKVWTEIVREKIFQQKLFLSRLERKDVCLLNQYLNYGYSILLSAMAKEIVSRGYCTQIGIGHNNQFNQFNFASDLIEPFRILIDRIVYNLDIQEFDSPVKYQLINVLNHEVIINGHREYVGKAIRIYVKSACDALEEQDPSVLKFYRYTE